MLDLVHPSIYPLVYGQSEILEEGTCGVDDCVSWIGKGKVLKLPSTDLEEASSTDFSTTFQWLPSEFEVPKDSERVITRSYINNIHPRHHPELYQVIPKFIAKAVPLWDRVLSCVEFEEIPPRVSDWSNSDGYGYHPDFSEDKMPQPESDEDDDDWQDRIDVWKEAREIYPPEPTEFKTSKERLLAGKKSRWSATVTTSDRDPPDSHPEVNLRTQYGKLQIIIKLANINLTPDKPSYPGGSWHVEGQGNEAM